MKLAKSFATSERQINKQNQQSNNNKTKNEEKQKMRVLGGSLKAGTKLKDQQGTDDFLSQVNQPNNKYRLFASVASFDDELSIVAPSLFGRSCDPKKVGTSLHLCNDYETLDSGKIVDKSPLGRYAAISRILYEAECAYEIADVQRKAKDDAENMGEQVDAASLKTKMDAIELKYHGGEVNNQKIIATENFAIDSPRIHISTSFVLVKLDVNNKPETDSIKRVTYIIGGKKRSSQLEECLKNADPDQLAAGYIEMKWDYTGSTEKKVCGANAKFEAVPKDQQIATTHATWWAENQSKITDLLIFDPEVMIGRNRNFSYQISSDELVKRFKKMCSEKRALIRYIDLDADETKRAAADLATIDAFMNNSKFNEAITAIIEAKKAENAAEEYEDEAIDAVAADIAGSATLSEAVGKAGGIDTLADIIGGVGDDDMDMPADLN